MLTKRDYNELVRIIKVSGLMPNKFVDMLCDWLRQDNPNFDESKFRAALGSNSSLKSSQMTKRR